MRAVAAIPAVGLLAGCALGLLAPDIPPLLEIVAMAAGLGVAVWALWSGRSRWLLAAVAIAFCAGGARLSSHAWQRAWRPPLRLAFERLAQVQRAQARLAGRFTPVDDEAFATVTGVLRADAALVASGVSLSLDVDDPAAGGIVVTVAGTVAAHRVREWRAGRRVRLPVQLRRTSRYLDPGVPDFERALARRGTTLVGSVKSGALVDVIERGGWYDERISSARAFARLAIANAVGRWNAQSGAIVSAIVIGDRVGLDEDVQRRLQEAGTYHVIAISGGNIAILAGLLFGAFRLVGLLGRGAALVTIATLVAYASLVGSGASVDRATLMGTIYLAGCAIDQRSPPLNTLAVVCALLMAAEPLSLIDPAFVLTVGATLAILIVAPVVQRQPLPRIVRPIATMLVASMATEAMLLPVGALIFSRVTFAGLGLNFLAIPLMGVAQIAGMVVVPVALVSARAAAVVGWVAHVGALGLVRSADLVRYAPWVSFRVAPPAVAAVIVYYAALGVSWILWRRKATLGASGESLGRCRLRRASMAVALFAGVWIAAEPWAFFTARGDGLLHAAFVDVGQGDAIFLRLPHGSTLLVDTGGLSTSSSFDIGDRVVAPMIRERGVRRLDFVALTHGDPDHIGGAAAILREFRPGEVWEGIPVPRSEPLAALRLQALSAGVRWTTVSAGHHVVVDDVDIRVRHPPTADWERQRVRNDDSIVLDLAWRDVQIVLTGDIGKAVERTLAPTLRRAPLRILKMPHHGSLTSSTPEFVRAFEPQIAVVSVGRTNHFGHPVPVVLQRYEDVGTEIFRTDKDGAVTIDTDGHSVDVSTFAGGRFHVSMSVGHEGAANTTP